MRDIESVAINPGDSAPTFRKKLAQQKMMAEAALQRTKFSIEHFGKSYKQLTQKERKEVREKYPLLMKRLKEGEKDADALLKELGY